MLFSWRASVESRSPRACGKRVLQWLCPVAAIAAILPLVLPIPACAQEITQFESDLAARRHVFRSAAAGFRAIRRGPKGNYYVLTAPAAAVQIYDRSGERQGQVPSESVAAVKGAAIVYGEDFDVDSEGRVVVCDRGANAVKIYLPSGQLSATITIPSPISVVWLPGGEFAVASPKTEHLVTGYDLAGKLVREYGDREEISERADVNDQVNFGHIGADPAGNSYFSFDYLPEPTVRKYDRVGYLATEISLKTTEFEPAATAARKIIARLKDQGSGVPALHRIISAVGVDPESQEVWIAIGTLLMRFSKDGDRLASFRTYLPYGDRMEASEILVEPDRLLIGSDPQGIYEFPKPAKIQ